MMEEPRRKQESGIATIALLCLVVLGGLALSGCAGIASRQPPIQVWDDMKQQPRYPPQGESALFPDQQASRRPVEGTVARGLLHEDDGFYTGVVNNMYIGKVPVPVTMDTLKRGQQRYNIYCAPCHDRTGAGHGIVATRSGSWIPANLQDDRVKQMVDGEIFNIITYGRRSMPSYRAQIPEQDRWAIVTYVRALHRTTTATIQDVPEQLRDSLR